MRAWLKLMVKCIVSRPKVSSVVKCYAVLWCLYRLVFIGPTYHHIPWLKVTEDGDDVSLKDFVCELCGRKLILEIGVCRFCKARNNLYREWRSRFERGVFSGRNYLIVRKSQLRRLDGSSSQNVPPSTNISKAWKPSWFIVGYQYIGTAMPGISWADIGLDGRAHRNFYRPQWAPSRWITYFNLIVPLYYAGTTMRTQLWHSPGLWGRLLSASPFSPPVCLQHL